MSLPELEIRTNNMLKRIMRKIRRRTRVVGNFPDGRSALMLVAARLRHIAGTKWGTKRYLDMERLREQEVEERTAQTA
jgi:transposase-like protein